MDVRHGLPAVRNDGQVLFSSVMPAARYRALGMAGDPVARRH
jgi:hypothetical protein